MSHCKVWLDNYTGQYYPGNQIQGRVILNFDSETKLRCVTVKLSVKEHTEFMGTETYYEPASNEQRSRDTLFQGDNEAFVTEVVPVGRHGATTSLPAGQHIYPFSFLLPSNIPGTYSCEYGSINYKLKATVDRPMAFDYEDEAIIVVISPIDLNLLGRTDLLEPTSLSEDKTLCCWCCAEGPIALDVEVPRKTLIPGETVQIAARVTNHSNTNLEGIQLKLKEIISCRVEVPSSDDKEITNTIVELNEGGLGAHGENTFNFNVMLPLNFPVPNFALCRLFKVEYVYKVVARIPGMHSNLEVEMNPVVGNIPYGQAPGGFVPPNPMNPVPYPPANTQGYPPTMPYPSGEGQGYPPTNGQGFAPDQGKVYPPISAPGYPPQPSAGFGPYPPPVGGVPVFPPTAPSAPTEPSTGFNPKAQEAASLPYSGGTSRTEPGPPSYDSLNQH